MPLETIVISEENQYDIFIIGSGPAGLTAAMYGARSGLKTCFIEKSAPGGKLSSIKTINNFPGYESLKGTDLASSLYKQAIDAGAKYLYGTVTNVVKKLGYWAVYGAEGNTWFTKALIIASGTENTKLNVAGEEQYSGIGISYCATCDGKLTAGKNTIVIGNDIEAITSALYLSPIAKKVTLIWEHAKLPSSINANVLKEKNITVLLNKVAIEVDGNTYNVSSLTVRDNASGNIEKVSTEFIFVNRGYSSSIKFAEGLNVIKDGIIEVDENKATKDKGIFAAGDVSKKDNKQIITAINDGAVAAMNAIKYVNEK